MKKLQTAWTVFRSGAWVGVASTGLTALTTYGFLDAAERGTIVNACAGTVSAANVLWTVVHARVAHKAITAVPTATLVGPTN